MPWVRLVPTISATFGPGVAHQQRGGEDETR